MKWNVLPCGGYLMNVYWALVIRFENSAKDQLHRENEKCWQAGGSQIFVEKPKLYTVYLRLWNKPRLKKEDHRMSLETTSNKSIWNGERERKKEREI